MKKNLINKHRLNRIIKESVRKVIKENTIQDEANEMFENMRDTFDKDGLIDSLWFFLGTLGQQANFINYLYTSGNVADDEENSPFGDFYRKTKEMEMYN